eukprot:603967-Karenia_brevis.AAC.1
MELISWTLKSLMIGHMSHLGPPSIGAKKCQSLAEAQKTRHFRWRTDNKLQEDDFGVVEHEVLSEVVDVAVEYDQLDLSNLASFE